MAFKSHKQRRAFFYQIGIKNVTYQAPKGFTIHSVKKTDYDRADIEIRKPVKKYIGEKK